MFRAAWPAPNHEIPEINRRSFSFAVPLSTVVSPLRAQTEIFALGIDSGTFSQEEECPHARIGSSHNVATVLSSTLCVSASCYKNAGTCCWEPGLRTSGFLLLGRTGSALEMRRWLAGFHRYMVA